MSEKSVEKVFVTVVTVIWYLNAFLYNRLGYCNAADVIELKGRVACEIDA